MTDPLITISEAVQNGDQEQVIKTVGVALKAGVPASALLEKALVPGIRALGEKFKNEEVFLPEVLIAIRAMNRGVEELKPHFTAEDAKKQYKEGTVVIGTVEGDLHDIGKNLVGMMLRANGFNVVDVGVDVSADSFISAAKENGADVVAMSGLLTTTITYMPTVIEGLKKAGLRYRVKIMVGGAPVTRQYADEIGVEGFAEDCASAVDEARRLMKL